VVISFPIVNDLYKQLVETFDENQSLIFYNQMALFMVGAGNFGGKRTSSDTSIKPLVDAPKRDPDAIVVEKTSFDQVF